MSSRPNQAAQELADQLVRWQMDPVAFVREALGAEPRPWQADVLRAYLTRRRISVASGHGVGKSALASWLVLYHHMTRFPAKTCITSNSFDQLKATFWAELQAWFRRLPAYFQKQFDCKEEILRSKSHPESSFAVMRTASTPEAMQGFHSENTLIIADEASGIEDKIFEALSGAMTEANARTILMGNPTKREGLFFKSHHELSGAYYTQQINCEECEWISPEWLEEQRITYGPDSNAYRVRVLGQFPTEIADSLIPVHLIESAVLRQIDPGNAPVVWGVDVSSGVGADRSALCKRCGPVLLEPVRSWHDLDPAQLANAIITEYQATPVGLRPGWILVDSIGVGSGTVGVLKEHGLPVRGVNVAEASANSQRFARLRDELWFKTREWLETRSVSLPKQDQLLAELAAPKYTELDRGVIKVESKKDMKRRGLRSPDLADSLILTHFVTDAQARRGHPTLQMKPFVANHRFSPFAA